MSVEATIKTPTWELALAAAVLVAAAYLGDLPMWLAVVPMGLLVAEGVILLVYQTRLARTAATLAGGPRVPGAQASTRPSGLQKMCPVCNAAPGQACDAKGRLHDARRR